MQFYLSTTILEKDFDYLTSYGVFVEKKINCK